MEEISIKSKELGLNTSDVGPLQQSTDSINIANKNAQAIQEEIKERPREAQLSGTQAQQSQPIDILLNKVLSLIETQSKLEIEVEHLETRIKLPGLLEKTLTNPLTFLVAAGALIFSIFQFIVTPLREDSRRTTDRIQVLQKSIDSLSAEIRIQTEVEKRMPKGPQRPIDSSK